MIVKQISLQVLFAGLALLLVGKQQASAQVVFCEAPRTYNVVVYVKRMHMHDWFEAGGWGSSDIGVEALPDGSVQLLRGNPDAVNSKSFWEINPKTNAVKFYLANSSIEVSDLDSEEPSCIIRNKRLGKAELYNYQFYIYRKRRKAEAPNSLTDCITRWVRDAMENWEVKDEFEKTDAYLLRVSDESRRAQVLTFQNEALEHYTELYAEAFKDRILDLQNVHQPVLLSPYDADNETFELDFGLFGKVVLPVAIGQARQFKESFDSRRISNYDFVLNHDEFLIASFDYKLNEDTFSYDLSNRESYHFDDVQIELTELDLDYLTATSEDDPTGPSSVTQSKPQGMIQFNSNPKDVVVERVSVVPVKGESCMGVERSGQELASVVEGSLLGIYDIVERRNLERVLDEQKLALSGILFEKSAVEAGCNIGAQGIVFTEFGCLSGRETIQVKLVDCQTSELYWSATGFGSSIVGVIEEIKRNLEIE